MLDIYKLSEAINESASYGGVSNVQALRLFGDIHESSAEASYIMMSEAASFQDFLVSADEILVEAALNNASSLEIIQENVFTAIFEKGKKFIEKVIAAVKAIIEKIKAYFARVSGNTSKWLAIMKPKVSAKIGTSGIGDLEFTGYKWDEKFVTDTIVGALETIMFDKNVIDGQVDELEKMMNTGLSKSEDEIQQWHDEQLEELTDDAITEAKEEIWSNFATAANMQVDHTTTSKIWSELTKVAHGGDGGEKITIKFSEVNPSGMLNAIEKTPRTISDIKKLYDAHLRNLEKYRKSLDSAEKKVMKSVTADKEKPTAVQNMTKNILQKSLSGATSIISEMETIANGARSLNVRLLEDMAKDYMGALTKFANFKEKKRG